MDLPCEWCPHRGCAEARPHCTTMAGYVECKASNRLACVHRSTSECRGSHAPEWRLLNERIVAVALTCQNTCQARADAKGRQE